jgi:hypothetical protein
MSSYNPDHVGMGQLLRSEGMQRAMLNRADLIMARAIAIAPIDTHDDHPGRYKASFHTRVHDRGGATHDRAEAVVYNDSPEAIYVEFGHRGREPFNTLRDAAFRL